MVDLEDLMKAAIEARKRALTFRTAVGVAYETYDGKIYSGFNLETYGHKGEHAEEVGLMRLLADGYMGTDVRRMVEVFQDAGHEDTEIFPACFTCWARMWEFLHPYLEIIVVDTDGNVVWQDTLYELLHGVEERGAEIFPSNRIRLTKPKQNFHPRLPLNPGLEDLFDEDDRFKEYCEQVLEVKYE
jgi:cytidine deaminase